MAIKLGIKFIQNKIILNIDFSQILSGDLINYHNIWRQIWQQESFLWPNNQLNKIKGLYTYQN